MIVQMKCKASHRVDSLSSLSSPVRLFIHHIIWKLALTAYLALNTVLSPGACVLATLKDDGEVKLDNMQYMHGSLKEITENDGTLTTPRLCGIKLMLLARHDTLAAILALQYSSACMQYKVTDDVISLLPKDLSLCKSPSSS
jgi:hypothetical protein